MSYFSMGYWVLGLSILVAMAGALIGLICIRQSTKSVTSKFRLVWLASAAVSIGGIGTWLAIFVSMLGVTPASDTLIRYDVARLTGAAVLAVLSVFGGLMALGRTLQLPRLLAAGVLMGLGLNLMLALGMSAVQVRGDIEFGLWQVIVSGLLGVVISLGTLWFVLRSWPTPAVVGASALFGCAVVGMHYLRMAGLELRIDPRSAIPTGEDLFSFLVPMFVIGMLSLAVPITAVLVAPDRRTPSTPPAPVRRPEFTR
ncbi:MHYT domain-containing protein [Nocardia amikacinitolerans]|uniref:MHYT domain-containing protein n=1 Tax=Nocardia amikacinitolerans TaxID=756689 RepID=UPI0036C731A4